MPAAQAAAASKPDNKMRETQSAPPSGQPSSSDPAGACRGSHQQRHPRCNYYHRKLLTPLLVVIALSADFQRANGADLKQPAVQRRYLMMDPMLSSAAAIGEQHAAAEAAPATRPMERPDEQQRRHLMSLAAAGLLEKNRRHHQQRSLWTQDSSQTFQQQQQAASDQFVSYRPLVAASTMPSINRQIQPPNPFYELTFAPTNTLQVEHHQADSNNDKNHPQQQQQHHDQSHQLDELEPHFESAMSQPSPVRLDPAQQQRSAAGATAQSIELPQQQQQQQSEAIQTVPEQQSDNKGGESARNSQQPPQQQEQLQSVDKIEPRQRRRLFNRILKKAEWNHLFVELSKVFLRYFLDLALKDIIGKQSGSSVGSSSGGSETTSRKKLDAQSELADLLKEFVKNAISNI